MRHILRFLSLFLIAIIGAWVILAGIRTLYNFSKIFTEENKWIFASDEQRREMAFGDLHFFYRFVQLNTPLRANILFLSPGAKVYYLGRYYLYPRKVTFAHTMVEAKNLLKTEKFDFFLVYQTKDTSLDENNSSIWKTNSISQSTHYVGLSGAKGTLGKL